MSRREVLKAFKQLHRITQSTFEGDARALIEARQRINQEFKKKFPEEEISEKLKVANDVGNILKRQVVQLSKKQDEANYEMKLKKDTIFQDNIIFKDDVILPQTRTKKCKPDSS